MNRINRKCDLHNQRWRLVEVAISNPFGPHHEIGDSRPTHACRAIGPCRKVRLLVAFQLHTARLESNALELNRLLSTPSHDKRTRRVLDQIRILPGGLDCIEDDLQFRSRRDADQCGLRCAIRRCAGYDPIEKSRHERVNSRSIHPQPPGTQSQYNADLHSRGSEISENLEASSFCKHKLSAGS